MEVSGEEAPRGELITRYIEASAAQEAVDVFSRWKMNPCW